MRKIVYLLLLLTSLAGYGQQTGEPTAAEVDSLLSDTIFQHLSEIEVKAIRPLIKTDIDRLAYDVQADADSRTNTALEMLRKVPLVAVDGQDNITIRGASNFKIYKNGHPDPSLSSNAKDVLKAIPANMIKRIEVITEPGAKYDAEGVGAILNIVMIEGNSIKGVTGTVTAGIDTYANPRGSAYVTTQIGPVVASVNYGYHHQGNNMKAIGEEQFNFTKNGNKRTSHSESSFNGNVHYGNVEFSYEPDTLNLLSASFGGFYYNMASDVNSHMLLLGATDTLQHYNTITHQPTSSYYSLNGRADYQHRTRRKGEALTLSYMISASRSANEMNASFTAPEGMMPIGVNYSGYDQDGRERFMEHTFQFDWTRPFALRHTIETGLKYINRRNTSNTTMTYAGDAAHDFNSRFRHITQVAAAYLSYTYRYQKLTARAGLRYEYSYLSARFPDGSQQNFHKSISDWVPSASLNYQFSFARSLKLSFATAIRRPGISYLNPAVVETPQSVNYGNPALESARNYSISLTYMQIGAKLTFNVAPSVSFSNNSICAVTGIDDKQRTFSTYRNALSERYYGLSGFLQWQVFDKTQLMVNGNVGYNDYHSTDLGLDLGRWSSFLYAQVTQQLPWKLRLTANVGKWGGDLNGLYSYMGHVWFHGLSLQRSWLSENRLTVSISAQNPFGGKYSRMKTHYVQGDYTGFSSNRWTQRMFSLSVSYRFGSLRANVKKTDKTIDNNDVVGGASAGGGQNQPSGGN